MRKLSKSAEEQSKKAKLQNSMKAPDAAMMAKFDKWDDRMNQKSRLGAMDVISKLKGAIHFIKKGALSGNADAQKGLDGVLAKMANMAGQTQAKSGNFLH